MPCSIIVGKLRIRSHSSRGFKSCTGLEAAGEQWACRIRLKLTNQKVDYVNHFLNLTGDFILATIELYTYPDKHTGAKSAVNIDQKLNRQSQLSLYYQLKHILLSQIFGGVYKDGDRLPSENELSKQYKVSRYVVRQALKDLVAEGKLVVHQGAGYFVNQKRFRKALPKLGSHTQSMASLGLQTQTLVVRQEIITPPEFVAESLLPPGEDQAIFIERVSYLEDEPVCVLLAYFPLKYRPVMLDTDLNNQSLYALLKKCCAVIPKRAETVISVAFADEEQSSLLGIREGMPLLHLGSLTWSESGELFEYSSSFYRIDRFELELEQT